MSDIEKLNRVKDGTTCTTTSAITCAVVEEEIDAYFDRDMDDLRHKRFERHIETCPSCADFVQQISFLRDSARQLADTPLSELIKKRLRERLALELGLHLEP